VDLAAKVRAIHRQGVRASTAGARTSHSAVSLPPELEGHRKESGGALRWSSEGEGKGEVASGERREERGGAPLWSIS